MSQALSYRIDRGEIQNIVGKQVDPYLELSLVLNMVKGKEVKLWLKTERFEQVQVRGIIWSRTEEVPEAVELWVEDWQGHVSPEPWAIKVLEVYS